MKQFMKKVRARDLRECLLKIYRTIILKFISFLSPSLFYLFTAGVEGLYFSLDHTQTHHNR
jgi:hypothetical protein